MRLIAKDGVLYDSVGQVCAIEKLPPGVSKLSDARVGWGGHHGKLFHVEQARAKVTKLYPLAEVLTLK